MEDGSILLETKGDANTVADGYYVKESNLVGKVIWYTGDDSTLASIFSFFTSEVGFLACIVFPGLLLMGLIFKDSVGNIRAELDQLLQEAEAQQEKERASDPLSGMNQDEYDEMYKRIRAELMEELMHVAEDTEEK